MESRRETHSGQAVPTARFARRLLFSLVSGRASSRRVHLGMSHTQASMCSLFPVPRYRGLRFRDHLVCAIQAPFLFRLDDRTIRTSSAASYPRDL